MPLSANDHPLVTIVQPSRAAAYQLVFRRDGKQAKRGTGTTDLEAARELARRLSAILIGKLFNNPPPDSPQVVLDMLGIQSAHDVARDVGSKSFKKLWGMIAEQLDHDQMEELETSEDMQKFGAALKVILRERDGLKTALAKTQQELDRAKQVAATYKQKADAYEALRVKEGKAAARSVLPKTLREAAVHYCAENASSPRYAKNVKNILERLITRFGAETDVNSLEESAVLEYIKAKAATTGRKGKPISGSTMRQECTYVCAMLEAESNVSVESVKKFVAKEYPQTGKGEGEYHWLENGQTAALIKAAAKKEHGEYWSDAMLIQHHLALRPEEIPMLQASNVHRGKRNVISHVYLEPLEVRGLKTERSKASIPVASKEARDAIQRRLKAGHKFLFARVPECGAGAPRRIARHRTAAEKAELEFQRANNLWQPQMFDREYLKWLRSAAEDVKGINKEKLDSRTLRRTRGRDITLATKSLTATATFLRDSMAVVERHYARLLPMDIKIS